VVPADDQHLAETEIATAIEAALVSESSIRRDVLPIMAAEDFAGFLDQRPRRIFWQRY